MFKKSIAAALALLTFLGGASVNAEESIPNPSRQVAFGNATPKAIVGFFVTIAGKEDWTLNFIKENPIMPGQVLLIDFTNDEQACQFDLKVFLTDGKDVKEETFKGADVCQTDAMAIVLNDASAPKGDPLAAPVKRYDI